MRLAPVDLAPLAPLEAEPVLGEAVYAGRIAAARERMDAAGLDALLVYADREHYANVSFLTGFDPRFEEALLVLRPTGPPAILCGNESLSFCETAGIAVEAVLCQSFSLPSQDRSVRARVADGLAVAGLGGGDRVGMVGWKPIPAADAPAARPALAVPPGMNGVSNHSSRWVRWPASSIALTSLRPSASRTAPETSPPLAPILTLAYQARIAPR